MPSLHCDWKARYGESWGEYQQNKATNDEIKALKAEVKRLTMERDILKEAAVFFALEWKKYSFIKTEKQIFPVRLMCKVLGIHFSGYYDRLKEPQSLRAKIDGYYLWFIKQFWR